MQSLLEDPVFYNLLVNNNESLRSNSTSSSDLSPPITTSKSDPVKNEQTYDFSFLKRLSFPDLPASLQTSKHMNIKAEDGSDTATSYQSSIFSSSEQQHSNKNTILDDAYVDSIDDFFNKEMSLQINSEIHSVNHQLPQQSQSLPSPLDSENINIVAPSQKQFHRFYSSNPNMQFSSVPSKITKPSTSPSNGQSSTPTYHKCPFCLRQFKNKSYLARHLKKHDTVKDFKCPFFNEQHSKCHHLSGEFSRKDTYKAHLKSIHFIYPVGVFKCDRNLSLGRCAGCFKEFKNNNEWLTNHIENEECPGLAKFKKFE